MCFCRIPVVDVYFICKNISIGQGIESNGFATERKYDGHYYIYVEAQKINKIKMDDKSIH